MRRVICGVPEQHCQGTKKGLIPGIQNVKSHSTHEEAFKCYSRYLQRVKGYKKISSREYETPDGILLLTKMSRFGASFRPGKEGRWMPEVYNRGYIL